MNTEDWKFRAHLNAGRRSVTMEVKQYNGIELFRELGGGKPIYYIASNKTNFPDEESLIKHIQSTISTPQQ